MALQNDTSTVVRSSAEDEKKQQPSVIVQSQNEETSEEKRRSSAESQATMASLNTTPPMSAIGPSPSKERIHLTEVEETLLMVMWFRVMDARSATPILGDPYAQPVFDRCDVDMTRDLFPTDPRWARLVAHRAKTYDGWCREFLDEHADEPVTVLHLACGLDSRNMRVAAGPNVRWVDVDRPMVAELRKRLFKPPPADTSDYTVRTLNLTEKGWMRDIPADRPTLVLAEGLFPYLAPAQAQAIIHDLAEYFGRGRLVFDVVGSLMVRYSRFIRPLRSSGASFHWGVDDARAIEKFHPRLRLDDCVHTWQFMGRSASDHPPYFGKYGTHLAAALTSSFDDINQLLRFSFS